MNSKSRFINSKREKAGVVNDECSHKGLPLLGRTAECPNNSDSEVSFFSPLISLRSLLSLLRVLRAFFVFFVSS